MRTLLTAFILPALVLWPALSAGEIDRRIFKSRACHVRFKSPPDWVLTEQVAFPGVLVEGYDREGAQLSLAGERLGKDTSAASYAKRSHAILTKAGYRLEPLKQEPNGAYILSGVAPGGKRHLWQGQRLHGGVVFLLTLATSSRLAPRYALTFGDSLKSLEFTAPDSPSRRCPVPDAPDPLD